STSRSDSEYRRYQRTAQRISSGAVCRHLNIAGRVAFFTISSDYQPPPPKLQHIRIIQIPAHKRERDGVAGLHPRRLTNTIMKSESSRGRGPGTHSSSPCSGPNWNCKSTEVVGDSHQDTSRCDREK